MNMSSLVRSFLTAVVLCAASPVLLAAPSESAAFCSLTHNQATVRSKLLGSAETFASVAPSQTDRSALQIGIRKSLGGIRQAGLINEIAAADCEAYGAKHEVDSALTSLEARIGRQAQTARKAVLKKALTKAEENLSFEQKALAAHVASWADVRAALDARDAIVHTLGIIDESLVRLAAVPDGGALNMRQVLGQSVDAQARAVALRSRLDATSAWDLKLEAGMKREFGIGTQNPYVGFVLTRSLGASSADAAVQDTGRLAAEYVRAQEQGGPQSFTRKVTEMRGVYDRYAVVLDGLNQRLSLLAVARNQVMTVSTTSALRMARNLATEMLQVEAEKVAFETRQHLLGVWLAEHEGP